MNKANIPAITAVAREYYSGAQVEQFRRIVTITTGCRTVEADDLSAICERLCVSSFAVSVDLCATDPVLEITLYVPELLPQYVIEGEEWIEEEEVEV